MANRIWYLGVLFVFVLTGCAANTTIGCNGSSASATPAVENPAMARPADREELERDLEDTYRTLLSERSGEVYSGAVAGTNEDDFAIAVHLIDGQTLAVGESNVRFPLMSVSKPFTYAVALEQHGRDTLLEKIGINATGMAYNSMVPLAVRADPRQNPMVNAGAIAVHSLIRGTTSQQKLDQVVQLYSRLANRTLAVADQWRAEPRPGSYALAYQMKHAGLLEGDVDDVLHRYLAACVVAVDLQDLAQMGATLANGGIQPVSKEPVLKGDTVVAVLSAMVTAGMYEESGYWWSRAGVPAKSGVSGAVLAVVPGWGAIAAYSPRLDPAGNSVRAVAAILELVERWRLHSFERLETEIYRQGARRSTESS